MQYASLLKAKTCSPNDQTEICSWLICWICNWLANSCMIKHLWSNRMYPSTVVCPAHIGYGSLQQAHTCGNCWEWCHGCWRMCTFTLSDSTDCLNCSSNGGEGTLICAGGDFWSRLCSKSWFDCIGKGMAEAGVMSLVTFPVCNFEENCDTLWRARQGHS